MVHFPHLRRTQAAAQQHVPTAQELADKNTAAECGITAAGNDGAAEQSGLPPRIVVEQPDGQVYLGEDDARLEGERRDFEAQLQASQGQAALPGTERWLDLRRLLYASSLDALILTRKRHAAVLLSAHLCLTLCSVVYAPPRCLLPPIAHPP